jgi:hypothetical protein
MDPVVFKDAIDQLFPDINPSIKEKILQDVNAHMIEFLKEKAYTDDSIGLKALDEAVAGGNDMERKSKMYAEQIIKKFLSLNRETQQRINHDFDEELVNTVDKIYRAYV